MRNEYNKARKRVLKTCLQNGQSIFNFYGFTPDGIINGIHIYYHRSAKYFIMEQNKMFKPHQWRYIETIRGLF